MTNRTNELLQWLGAVTIIIGHTLNAIGPVVYPYNILAFTIGTVLFLIWAFRISSKPQLLVNIVSLAISVIGLIKAIN
jgi:type IV secretory pathway TrbL component